MSSLSLLLGGLDVETGVRNVAGVIESVVRADRWLRRRGDRYGVVVIDVVPSPSASDWLHELSALLASGVRDVDEVGRLDEHRFCVIAFDVRPQSVRIVAERIFELLRKTGLIESASVGALEVGVAAEAASVVAEAAKLVDGASPDVHLGTLE